MKILQGHLKILVKAFLIFYVLPLVILSLYKGELHFYNFAIVGPALTGIIIFLINLFFYRSYPGVAPSTYQSSVISSSYPLEKIKGEISSKFTAKNIKVLGDKLQFKTRMGMTWGDNVTISLVKKGTDSNTYKISSDSPYLLVDYASNIKNIRKIKELIGERSGG